MGFRWHHSVILHEAGVPPIHTPIHVFEKLSDDVKERLYLVHVAESSVPEDSGLKVAGEGVENTISVNIVLQLLEILKKIFVL